MNPRGFTVDTRVQVEEPKWSSPALTGFTARGVDTGTAPQQPGLPSPTTLALRSLARALRPLANGSSPVLSIAVDL